MFFLRQQSVFHRVLKNSSGTGSALTVGSLKSLRSCQTLDLHKNFSTSEEHHFKAETERLLDIVTHSIYTDKDIFLRELISNSSDALEKFRYESLANSDHLVQDDSNSELKISISADEEAKTLVIEDNGIGMTKEEMLTNLGTIAKSGSKQFLQQLEKDSFAGAAKESIIGQFGVGFYSAFMVAKSVDVYSRSAIKSDSSSPLFKWSSTGSGKFSIDEINPEKDPNSNLKNLKGTRIIINLKEDALDFLKESKINDVINARSRFVSFPIYVNEKKVNTVSALWASNPSECSEEQYKEFYKYHSGNFDDPLHTIHFRADVPLDIKCLLFIPSFNMEQLSTGQRLKKGVSLYSRKILIEADAEKILPEWLRFLKGVVDSEDLPISLSRESVQNSRLVANIREVLTKRVLRFLKQQSEKHPKDYTEKFYKTYSNFLKEGVCTDAKYIPDLSKLLRFNSSSLEKSELASFDEYISRCKPNQDKIYYLSCPNFEIGKKSPYLEIFDSKGIEVLFLYSPLDEFSLNNIDSFGDRKLVSVSSGLDMKMEEEEKGPEAKSDEKSKMNLQDREILKVWFKETLSDVVSEVRLSDRLKGSPALVVDHENISTRALMKQLKQASDEFGLEKQVLEINADHEIIAKISELRQNQEDLAKALARQVFDNATIAAGLVDDARDMLPRLNSLLEKLLKK